MSAYLQRLKTAEERLWEKVDKSGGENACWPYTKAVRNSKGYGAFWMDGKTVGAHKAAYRLSIGPIPIGLDCLHNCDNPLCCNPNHLWLGTNDDNVADKVAKGRQAKGPKHSAIRRKTALRGENHPFSRLSTPEIVNIRKMRKAGWILKDIGRLFSVSLQTVRTICIGKGWAHIK